MHKQLQDLGIGYSHTGLYILPGEIKVDMGLLAAAPERNLMLVKDPYIEKQ